MDPEDNGDIDIRADDTGNINFVDQFDQEFNYEEYQ